MRIFVFSAAALIITLGGCGQSPDDVAQEDAIQLIKSQLTAPETFKLKKAETFWASPSTDKKGYRPYIIQVNFTSKNLMGVPLDGCFVVGISVKGDEYKYRPNDPSGINGGSFTECLDPNFVAEANAAGANITQEKLIEVAAKRAGFNYPGTSETSPNAAQSQPTTRPDQSNAIAPSSEPTGDGGNTIMPNASEPASPTTADSVPSPAIEACVDKWIASFRKSVGPTATINFDQVGEWQDWCEKGKEASE
jgi:hypothetical protein